MKYTIPKEHQITGLYSIGKQFTIADTGEEYMGAYMVDKTTGIAYTGIEYNISTSKQLKEYLPVKIKGSLSDLPKKKIKPPKETLASGVFFRYFVKEAGMVLEVNNQTWKRTLQRVAVKWVFRGNPTTVTEIHGGRTITMPGVGETNRNAILAAESVLPGITQYIESRIGNYIEHYIESSPGIHSDLPQTD